MHSNNSIVFLLPHFSDANQDSPYLLTLLIFAQVTAWEMLMRRVVHVLWLWLCQHRFVAGRQWKLHVRSARTKVEYHGGCDTLHIYSR